MSAARASRIIYFKEDRGEGRRKDVDIPKTTLDDDLVWVGGGLMR
jgi:hypothetical protein